MVDIISYIKSLVFPSEELSRKRRAGEDYVFPGTVKMRRIGSSPLSSSSEEDWLSTSSSSTIRPRVTLRTSKSNPGWPLVVLDDDIPEAIKAKHEQLNANTSFGKSRCTSTPRSSFLLNGSSNEDVTFLKATQSIGQKKVDAKKQSLEYVKPFSYLDDHPKKSTVQNGTRIKDFSIPILKRVSEVRNKLGLSKRQQLRSAILDQSYRLDEKLKYQELLARAATNSKLPDSFSKYSTPTGKLFAYGTTSRGKKLVELSTSKVKPTVLIDLTSYDDYTTRSKSKSKLSTKDTIKKVLSDYDNDTVVVKDSDSDLEILPNPPSPKPDITVPRVNSLKKIVDSTERSHKEWLQNVIQRHRKAITNYERQISTKTTQTEKLKEITSEIHSQRLGDQLAKYLHIKDAVLPERVVEEDAFPLLSDENEARINIALNRRANQNEVLSAKFNLNITRRDIMTLAGLNWLNDEVINFYMNLIIERGKMPQWPKAYAMNTFFYPKLLKDGHSSLKRWTRRVDIFSYDVIAVPVHLGVHWCMSIINFRNQTIGYYDSMGSGNKQCLEALRMYLEDEHLDKKQSQYNTSNWKLINMQKIPHQMNGSDCGMFACTFAEVVTRGAKITFSQEHMPYLRRKMILEILNGELMIQ